MLPYLAAAVPQAERLIDLATPEEIIVSTLTLARAVLATDCLDKHKRGFLNGCVWMVTEANGKYGVPYWSEGVYELVKQHGGELRNVLKLRPMPIRHEQVNPRKLLVNEIMKAPHRLEEILREQAIACLVTADEHKRLNHKLVGFERYTDAGIGVWEVCVIGAGEVKVLRVI